MDLFHPSYNQHIKNILKNVQNLQSLEILDLSGMHYL